MRSKVFLSLKVVFPLCIAGSVYLLLRPTETVVYRLFDAAGLSGIVNSVRVLFNPNNFFNWFVYSLPGGLWLYAFQNAIAYLNGIGKQSTYSLILLASLSGFGLELFQLIGITDGRFDWIDIYFYAAFTSLALLSNYFKRNNWELYVPQSKSPLLLKGAFLMFVFMIYLADII